MSTKTNFPVRCFLLAAVVITAGGCSAFTTTSNSIRHGFHATTNSASSTSDSVGDVAKRDNRALAFVQSRLPSIREDAARGGGENVATLARLLGRRDPENFARWMQGHYQALFTRLNEPRDLLARIDSYPPR